jgi:hypothetical protein
MRVSIALLAALFLLGPHVFAQAVLTTSRQGPETALRQAKDEVLDESSATRK